MATYAVQNFPHAGANITYTSPVASGDIATCGASTALLVVNPSANGTVTVALQALGLNVDGLTAPTRTVSITQGNTAVIPVPTSVYGSSVALTYTGTLTTVQGAVITFPGS